jgi:hypothetical protein
MPTVTDELTPLSGVVLPLVLRRKLQKQKQVSKEGTDETSKVENDEALSGMMATANRIFTAEELEERISLAKKAIEDIQKQLCRGEESYYEETNNHGNLYRGWDAFIDAKDVGNSASVPQSLGTSNRRMPADHRWFSSSCGSVGRLSHPAPLSTRSLSTTEQWSDVRSETNTPIPTVSLTVGNQSEAPKSLSGREEQIEHVAVANTESLPKEGSIPLQTATDDNYSAVPEIRQSTEPTEGEAAKTEIEDPDMMNTDDPTSPSTEAAQVKNEDSGRRTRKRKLSES